MANVVAYKKFKRQVLQNADFECEMCHTSDSLTVHHMLKQSTFPQYKLDPVNGVCLCGKCHAKVEQMWRDGEDCYSCFPERLCKAHEHFKVTWKQLGVKLEEDAWEEGRSYGGL